MFGLAVAFRAGTIRDVFAGEKYLITQTEDTMTQTSGTQRSTDQPVEKAAIRPFPKVKVPEAEIAELRRRIKTTKWPERETVTDASQGVQLAMMQALARYWATDYDWRKIEAKMNALPQFVTEIDGLDIHFIHVRSKHENALPLIVTHGWPGSIIEQMKITISWFTNTALSGARLYWENWGKFGYFNAKGVQIPVAVSVFPDELYPAPRSWAQRAYPKLVHYNRLEKGGHFAAWEQPELFVNELRESLKSFR